MTYISYRDLRGEKAKEISVAIGIEDKHSRIPETHRLVEVREADDHVRLSVHASRKFTEVLIFDTGSLELIRIDTQAKQTLKTIYDRTKGSIQTLQSVWSDNAQGFQDAYEEIGKLSDAPAIIASEWDRYKALAMKTGLCR